MALADQNKGNSSQVSSNQDGPNVQLADCVKRNLRNAWCEPLHPPSVRAFEELSAMLTTDEVTKLVLDSGCGTGGSTKALAERYPEKTVIGVDRSAARLRQLPPGSLVARQGNCIWVRARLESFWRLVYGANWEVQKHYLLYPNPWPKSDQMNKRWHAHPVFPVVLALCDNIELRTNWDIYAEEFASVIEWSTGERPRVGQFSPIEPISPFERKYSASAHPLYRVRTLRV